MTTYLGLYVNKVSKEGSGLKEGDVILQYDKMKVTTLESFSMYLTDNLDKQVSLVVLRNNTIIYITYIDVEIGISCSPTIVTTNDKILSNPTSEDIAASLAKAEIKTPSNGRSEAISASAEAEGTVKSVVFSSQSGLVNTLNVFAWLVLGFGAILSIMIFISTAMMSGVYGTHFNIFGFAYTVAAVFHTALAFVVLKVLVKIATDIEAMRG